MKTRHSKVHPVQLWMSKSLYHDMISSRVEAVLDSPLGYLGRVEEHCPWMVITGESQTSYYLPLLCPVCGKPYHITPKSLRKMSDEMQDFVLESIYYSNPSNSLEYGPQDAKKTIASGIRIGWMNDDGEFTPQAQRNIDLFNSLLDHKVDRAGHIDDDRSFPHFALVMLRPASKTTQQSIVLDGRRVEPMVVRVHPVSLLSVRIDWHKHARST